MDWSAVALLLAERAELPAVLVGQDGELLLLASTAERALGWSLESVGHDWIHRHVPTSSAVSARWLFGKALSGALRRLEVDVLTSKGVAKATFEACAVGFEGRRGVLLLLEKLSAPAPEVRCPEYDYEVQELAAGAFNLRSISCMGSSSAVPPGCCYQVLHGRSTPCNPCPLRTEGGIASPRAVVEVLADGEYRITTASFANDDVARVSVRRLPVATFSAVLQAKLDALSARGRLSQRERDVLRHLVEGRTLDEIAEALSITSRTVRFHQSNLLQKLGADSRADLMRLIL